MKRYIKSLSFKEGIALILPHSAQSLVVFDNIPANDQYANGYGVTVIPTYIVKEMAIQNLKCLPGILYFFETFRATFFGIALAVIGFASKNPRAFLIGVLLALPYAKCVTRFVSDMINSSGFYRKHFKKTYQHNAAANMVLNAYYDLDRVPSFEEAKKYGKRQSTQDTLYDYYYGYTYLMLFILALISPLSFLASPQFIFIVAAILLITYGLFKVGLFNSLEDYTLEEPTDNDIELVLLALSSYENSDKILRYLQNIEYQLYQQSKNMQNKNEAKDDATQSGTSNDNPDK